MQKLSNNKKLLIKLLKAGVDIIDPESVYIEGEVKVGALTTILPNVCLTDVIIGKNCIIGPVVQIVDSRIGNDVYIGFTAQIKRCIIKDGVHMAHHSYLGDSQVGKNANISAGAITCNYDGKNKHKTVIGENAFIGSNVCLIAPNKIGKGVFIAAGSVIPANTKTGENNLIICREKEMIIKKLKNNKINE
jgi:bifunctional UDP-N-acetylglucosamine pyrophosphorylase/glucosamine-1-phosphate N-acetyltransferase